jgi:hypothetical protein
MVKKSDLNFIRNNSFQNIVLFCLLFFSSSLYSLSQDQNQNVRYVYVNTTAEAIDELNQLIPNYEKRKAVLIEMKKLEKEGVVFLSNNQFAPILKKIEYANSKLDIDQEDLDYARDAKKRYLPISNLIK